MPTYTIRHRNGSILHEGESASYKAFVEQHKSVLFNANLRDADLCGADLRYANLRDADLSGANLFNANLRHANLRDADLSGANLFDADLRDVNLSGVKLNGLVIDGGCDHIVAFTYDGEHYLNIGCVSHPLGCWQEHYKEIGAYHGYSKRLIEEYGIYIECCAKVLTLNGDSDQ